jgi:D-alanyl-D-alanine carboxypeptidase/D-alanyl-D-alanine-endopeptidase (penicillin-binding protein 4)
LVPTSFRFSTAASHFSSDVLPFFTNNDSTAVDLLRQSFSLPIESEGRQPVPDLMERQSWRLIRSQPTDSLLKPMMHRSDNFFAEQSLLMVSNERLGL